MCVCVCVSEGAVGSLGIILYIPIGDGVRYRQTGTEAMWARASHSVLFYALGKKQKREREGEKKKKKGIGSWCRVSYLPSVMSEDQSYNPQVLR